MNELQRLGEDFIEEIEDIKKKRKNLKMDDKDRSMRELTNLMTKHDNFKEIKDDMISWPFPKGKRGQTMGWLFMGLGAIFLGVLILGIYAFIFNTINTSLDQDIAVTTNGTTLAYYNSVTFGVFDSAFLQYGDLIGISFIFGVILSMILVAYFTRDKYPSVFFIVDFVILIGAYIFSTYLAYSYNVLLTSTSYMSFYITYYPNTSTILLNLNKYVGIIGAIILIVSYSAFPVDRQAPNLREVEGGF